MIFAPSTKPTFPNIGQGCPDSAPDQFPVFANSRHAQTYSSAPNSNEALKPNVKAIRIAPVEPKTEAAPFTAKPQSIRSPTRMAAFGNGSPMKNPSGAKSATDTRMRAVWCIPPSEAVGCVKANSSNKSHATIPMKAQ